MTQEKTCKAINVSGSLIAAIENGRVIPRPETAGDKDRDGGTLTFKPPAWRAFVAEVARQP